MPDKPRVTFTIPAGECRGDGRSGSCPCFEEIWCLHPDKPEDFPDDVLDGRPVNCPLNLGPGALLVTVEAVE